MKKPNLRRIKAWAIWNELNGSYYRQMTRIGPAFGGTTKTAKKFKSKHEAISEFKLHWAFMGCQLARILVEE